MFVCMLYPMQKKNRKELSICLEARKKLTEVLTIEIKCENGNNFGKNNKLTFPDYSLIQKRFESVKYLKFFFSKI